jgi:hypothetical protein|tara:strand:+ start:911 stop:1384 length:474 start_codon:yes stop_codon:yes gene_type:complete
MATWTITGGGNTGHSADGKKVRVISEIVDFSEFTISTNDVIQVIELPANSLVLYAGLDVLTADSAGNSGTLSLGDGADVDRYVSASTATAGIETTRARAGDSSLGTTSIGYAYYAAADTIDLVNATGSINAKVRVFAVVADCDGLGDTEGQNVTFST